MSDLSLELLRSRLSYDPDTGLFERISTANFNPKAQLGKSVGCSDKNGYLYIRVGKKRYLAHRLAWFYVHGEWPVGDIDHINRVTNDNRIANLRVATPSQNAANTSLYRHNSSGAKGVCFDRVNNKWMAYMQVKGRFVNLGRFDDFGAAVAARRDAFSCRFREFARHA